MRSFAIATLLSAAAVNAATFTVDVGQSGFSYTPNNLNATAGDIIVFQFVSNIPHTVTQSSFNNPCVALSGGFDSTGSSVTTPPTFNYTVTSSDPVYWHCEEPTHCNPNGMVGAINIDSANFAAFQNGAEQGTTPSSASGGSSSTATGTGSSSSGSASTASGSGTSAAETATASSAAMQIGGGSAFGAAMALLVGLAL